MVRSLVRCVSESHADTTRTKKVAPDRDLHWENLNGQYHGHCEVHKNMKQIVEEPRKSS